MRTIALSGFTIFLTLSVVASTSTTSMSYDYDDEFTKQRHNLVIGLAISGGGFRSAAFAYGAMKKLNDIYLCIVDGNGDSNGDSKVTDRDKGHLAIVDDKDLCRNTRPVTILESVDVISAVSGGALPALYYREYGKQGFFGTIDQDKTTSQTRC